MALLSNCPKCGTRLSVEDALAGKKVRCPKCLEIFTMTAGTATAPSPALAQPVAKPVAQVAPPAAPITAKPPVTPPPLPPSASTDFISGLPTFKSQAAARAERENKVKETPKKPPVIAQVVGVIAAIIGAVIGRLAWLPVLIVVGFATVVGLPLYFLTSGARRRMVFAGALQAGHALWMLLGAFLLARGAMPGVSVDPLVFIQAILLFAGAIVVVFLPYLPVIIVMTVYQSAWLLINVTTLAQGGLPRDIRIALFLHLFLRVLGIAMMFLAYFEKPKEPALRDEFPSDELDQAPRDRPQRPKEAPLGLILALTLGGIVLVGGGIIAAYFVLRSNQPNQQGLKGPVFKNPENKPPENQPPARNWQVFAPPDGGFSVSFPGKPKHTSRRAENTNRTIHVYEVAEGGDDFSIATYDPPLPGQPPQLFQSLRGARSEFLLGQVDPERPVALGSYQGYELTIHFADRTIVERMLHGHGRSFTLRVSSARFPAIAGDAQQFFDSFRPVGMDQEDKTVKAKKPSNQDPPKVLAGMSSDILSVHFARDGKTLAAVSQNGEHRVWEISTRRPPTMQLFEKQPIRFLAYVVSADGQTAAACALNGQFYFLDPATFRPKTTLQERLTPSFIWSLAVSADGKKVAAGHDKKVIVWNTVTSGPQWDFPCPSRVNSLAFSPDGKVLTAGTKNNTIHLWDPNGGQDLKTLVGKPGGVPSAGAVWALACSPDSKTLAAGGNDHTVRLWNLSTRTERALLRHDETIRSMAFAPDGKLLAAGDDAGTVTLWTADGARKAFFPADSGRHSVRALAFSPDSALLAAGSGNQVRLWDLAKVRWEERR